MKRIATTFFSLMSGALVLLAAPPAVRHANPNISPKGNAVSESPYEALTLESFNSPDAAAIRSVVSKSARVTNPGKKAPAFAGASGSTIYGSLVVDYTNSWQLGVGEVYLDGNFTFLSSLSGVGNGIGTYKKLCGYGYNGHYYYVTQELYYGVLVLGTYLIDVDLATGDRTVTSVSEDTTPLYLAAYSTEDDKVYGLTQDLETRDITFGYLVDPTNPSAGFVGTGEIDGDNLPGGTFGVACTVNQLTNQFVVVSKTGQVSEVDKVTGEFTEIGQVEDISPFKTAICYSPYDRGYVYAVCANEGCSIQLLDANTFEVKSSVDYPGLLEFDMFYCPDTQAIEDSAPGPSKFVSASFPDGSLSGTLTYQLASVTQGGTPVIGDIDWLLEVDGTEYKRGSAAAGSKVTVEVKDLTEGQHIFSFKASLGGRFGRFLNNTLYIGNDTPVAPQKVELTGTKIVWTPVSEGVNGGYVNPKEVTYNVYLNDDLIARNVSSIETATKLDPEKPLEFYVAAVEAVFEGKRSEKTYSNDIAYGSALELPQVFTPTAKESRIFTIVDCNGHNGTDGAINFTTTRLAGQLGDFSGYYYRYNSSLPGDDYLFLPLMKFDDVNAVYEFDAQIFDIDGYAEKYEIVLATAPAKEAVVKVLRPETAVVYLDKYTATQEDANQQIYFSVPAAGDYMVGIHAISDPDEFRFFMNEFSVKKADGISVTGPNAVTELTAVAAEKGALNATVNFTLPAAQVDGAALAADAALTATVQADGCEKVNVTGKPGEAKSVVIPTLQGNNEVTVTVSNGESKGVPATTDVYTGVDVPYVPTNFKVTMSENNYTAHLTWEAPEIGQNGGYVAPTGFKYYLCEQVSDGFSTQWIISNYIGADVYSYDITIPEGTPQALTSFGLIAENLAGMSENLTVDYAVTGKPYAIPTVSNFMTGDYLKPTAQYTDNFSGLIGNPADRLDDFATEENLKALYTYSKSAVTDGIFSLPKFSTKDCTRGAIELTIWGGSCASFTVSATTFGVEETVLKTYEQADFAETGFQKVLIELPAQFQGKDWVEPFITFSTADGDESFILYAYRYVDHIPNDFGIIQLSGANNATVGEEAKFTAEIMNFGYEDGTEPAGKWTLTREDGTVLADVNVAATNTIVKADGTFSTSISYTPTADDLGKLVLTYAIAEGDGKANNDSKTVEVTVTVGQQLVVTDLHATEITGQNVDLAWTAPVSSKTEGLEEETPFEIVDEIAGFKIVDGDEAINYGLGGNYATQEWAFQPMGFMVWSAEGINEILGIESSYVAHEGDQYLVAFCPGEQDDHSIPQADDWLISPEVNGGSTFSFWARAFLYKYGPEKLEIMYSTTGNNPEDFKLLENLTLEGDAAATPEWEKYEYTLPADAKYFAIHYVSTDIFAIAIDDITYSAAGEFAPIEKYEIYRNGALIGTTADAAYSDTTVAEDTDYTYFLIPVLADGVKGLDSNTLVLHTTGIAGIGLDAQDAEWYNLQGVRMDGLRLEPGVYIRVTGDKAVKVIVK